MPATAIERKHQLRPQMLMWMLCDEALQLGDQLTVAAEREIDIDSLFVRREAKLLAEGHLSSA